MTSQLDHLEKVLKERGVLRVGDLVPMGFPKSYLGELEK